MDIYLVEYRCSGNVIGRYYSSPEDAEQDINRRLKEYSKFRRFKDEITLKDVAIFIEDFSDNKYQIFPKKKPDRPRFLGVSRKRKPFAQPNVQSSEQPVEKKVKEDDSLSETNLDEYQDLL